MAFGIKGRRDKILDYSVEAVLPSMEAKLKKEYEEQLKAWEDVPGMAMRPLPKITLAGMQHQARENSRIMHTGSGYMPEYGMVNLDEALIEVDRAQAARQKAFKREVEKDPKLFREAEEAYNASLKSEGRRGQRPTDAQRGHGH